MPWVRGGPLDGEGGGSAEQEAFEHMDLDGDGVIDRAEWQQGEARGQGQAVPVLGRSTPPRKEVWWPRREASESVELPSWAKKGLEQEQEQEQEQGQGLEQEQEQGEVEDRAFLGQTGKETEPGRKDPREEFNHFARLRKQAPPEGTPTPGPDVSPYPRP